MNKLIEYLKRKWPWFLFMTFLVIMLFFLLPMQEKNYLREDLKAIEKRSVTVAFILSGILALLLLYFFFKEPKFSNLPGLIGAIVYVTLIMYLVATPIIRFAILATNRFNSSEPFSKSYVIQGMTDSRTFLFFREPGSDKSEYFDNPLIKIDTNTFSANDTMSLSFKKGLFGYKYLADFAATKR